MMTSKPRPLPRLVAFAQLAELGVLHGRRQIDRLEAEGKFPRRVVVSQGRVGWVTAEVVAHVDAQIAARATDIGTLGSTRKRPKAPLLGKAAAVPSVPT